MSFPQVTADLRAYPEAGGGITQSFARPAEYTADPTAYSGMEAASTQDLIGRGRVDEGALPVAPNLGIGLDTAVGVEDFTYLAALPPGFLIEPPPTDIIATYRFYPSPKGVIYVYDPIGAEALFINRLGTFNTTSGGQIASYSYLRVVARTLSGASLVLFSNADQQGSIRSAGPGDMIYLELLWSSPINQQTVWGELQLRVDP